MSFKETSIYSIVNNKCPRCHEGHFFNTNNPYNLSQFSKMDKSCTVCGANYEPELGFYFGAMFMSYGINALMFVTLFLALTFIPKTEPSLTITLVSVIAPMLILTPVTFRLSRLLWIHFFVKYDRDAIDKFRKSKLLNNEFVK